MEQDHRGARRQAILPYSYSGTLGLVQMTVASARLWNRLGASQLERSICGAAAERAVEATLGVRWSPPYSAVEHSKLVVIWGHTRSQLTPLLPFLRRSQRQGCQVVVIDPREQRRHSSADWHLAPRPGTDGVLALGLARLIVDANKHDEKSARREYCGVAPIARAARGVSVGTRGRRNRSRVGRHPQARRISTEQFARD